MANILVVDDDEKSRKAICAVLASAHHAVTEAKDGKDAQLTMQTANFDLVISDIVMPHIDGIELLSWVKQNQKAPVILMTGFSHILETQKAFDLGADEFITKPFGYKEILNAINSVLDKSLTKKVMPVVEGAGVEISKTAVPQLETNEIVAEPDTPGVIEAIVAHAEPVLLSKPIPPELASKDIAYCRVPIEDFATTDALQLNIYVRLSAEKYLRVAHKGDLLPRDRVDNYRRKGVEFLYARKEDFARLVDFTFDFTKLLQRTTSTSAEKRTEFLRYTNDLIIERLFVKGFDKVAFDQACRNVQLCVSVISESESLFNLMQALNEHSDWIYAHSLGVSICSTMISRKIGWNSMSSLFKVGTASIFHDIGKKEIELDILSKSRPLLSHEERRKIDYHVTRSRELLESTRSVPGDILQIVHEHHEACNGMGFPRQLKKDRIHPVARVISVADRFCNYAIANPHSKGSDAMGALQLVQENYGDQLDPIAFGALKMLCASA